MSRVNGPTPKTVQFPKARKCGTEVVCEVYQSSLLLELELL